MWYNSGAMKTTFALGDRVRSKTNHQSLEEGGLYMITDVAARHFQFGTFVTYTVERMVDGTREEREVTNAHLLLEKV